MSSFLYDKARALLPVAVPEYQQVLTKPTRIYVVVERHNLPCPVNEPANADNFLWVKAHRNLILDKVLKAYTAHYPESQTDFALLDIFGNRLPLDITMGNIPSTESPEGQVKVVRAQEVPRGSAAASSRAQNTTTTANMAAPARIERQPLQPVIRQLSATPIKSAEDASQHSKLAAAKTSPLSRKPKMEPTKEDDSARPSSFQENLFMEDHDDVRRPTRGDPLRKLAAEDVAERLEAGVEVGVRALAEIEKRLQTLPNNADAQHWLAQIETVRNQSRRSRTVVGVVGNTGAGKSSVINALLEEERLVPTNCMRACTAVVTELSYNDSNDPDKRYRAEIEYIKPEDWEKELTVLVSELIDDNGHITKDVSNVDSEAAVAYSKVRAVYHKHTRDMLAKSSVQSLMRVPKVQKVLGKTMKIIESDPAIFYRRLQNYVDSKEKGTEKLDKNGNKITNPHREFESWPLIKVVRIYVKADALSTGAVIVDLPGVHDSNAARAAVAEGYMKQTSGLWIVAPINRAVDDKAAKNLLGDSFKRQLKFDGTYSAVTFICSKTDDISRMEATDTLKLGADMDLLEDKLSKIASQKRSLTKQLKDSRARKEDLEEAGDNIEEQVEVWTELQEKIEDGKEVFAPSEQTSKKRKKSATTDRVNKRRRRSVESDDESFTRSDVESDHDDEDASSASKQALTAEVVEQQLDQFKKMKREARREKQDLDKTIRELKAAIATITAEAEAVDAEQSALCIAGRNEYSRSAIKRDFAAGIREIDEETAEGDDPEAWNPDEAIRDYDEVANSLPVFCVSSRAYQKLSDRLKKDTAVAGFTTAEQTEIPQLQAHCKKLTEKGRKAGCKRFLNSVAQLLTSLELWSSSDGHGTTLTSDQKNDEETFLTRQLRQLDKELERVVQELLRETEEILQNQLFADFDVAARKSEVEAPSTVSKWHAPQSAGGLHFQTYRATIRRSGVFRQDFNGDLVEPIYKQLGNSWEKVFQRAIPRILGDFSKRANSILKQFHAAVEARCRVTGTGLPNVARLGTQLQQHAAVFQDHVAAALQAFKDGQRNINREFTPVVTEAMTPVYNHCNGESGKGMFMRMKGHMVTHISQQAPQMFQSSTDAVRTSLLKLCDTIRKSLLTDADGVYMKMRQDYLSLIGGLEVGLMEVSPQERGAKRDIDKLLEEVDGSFQQIADADMDRLKDVMTVSDAAEDAKAPGVKEEVGEDEALFVDSDSEDEDAAENDSAANLGDGETSVQPVQEGLTSGGEEHIEQEAVRADDDEL